MIDELANEERWSWFGLLLLAGDNPIEGEVGITNEIGYTDDQVAKILDVPLEIFGRAKAKMVEFGKIELAAGGIIRICNWKKYQSEYLRQRRYRKGYQSKLQAKVTSEGAPKSDQEKKKKRKKGEGRREKEIEDPTTPPPIIPVANKRDGDSRVKELIDYHFQAYGQKFPGESYIVVGGRDGAAFKRLLAAYDNLKHPDPVGKIKFLIDRYFEIEDSYIEDSGYTIVFFCSQVTKLQKPAKKNESNNMRILRHAWEKARLEEAHDDKK